MSMYCFVFNQEPNVVYTRFLSCACDKCKTVNVDTMLQCTNKSTVGSLVKRFLKKRCDEQPARKRRKLQ